MECNLKYVKVFIFFIWKKNLSSNLNPFSPAKKNIILLCKSLLKAFTISRISKSLFKREKEELRNLPLESDFYYTLLKVP